MLYAVVKNSLFSSPCPSRSWISSLFLLFIVFCCFLRLEFDSLLYGFYYFPWYSISIGVYFGSSMSMHFVYENNYFRLRFCIFVPKYWKKILFCFQILDCHNSTDCQQFQLRLSRVRVYCTIHRLVLAVLALPFIRPATLSILFAQVSARHTKRILYSGGGWCMYAVRNCRCTQLYSCSLTCWTRSLNTSASTNALLNDWIAFLLNVHW